MFRNFFYKYERRVDIQLEDKRSALLFRLVQFGIIGYIIYSMIKSEGWNYSEKGLYSVYTNVEGVNNDKGGNVWDAIDFIRPPQEKDSFFIATRVLITEQNQGYCTDNDEKNQCKFHWDCINQRSRNGINTGECDGKRLMCRIKGWCPVSDTSSPTTTEHIFSNVESFTVYVRNNIEFIGLKQFRSNDQFFETNDTCLYDPIESPNCPIFKIETILNEVDVRFENVEEKGAVISFFINWSCYFNGQPDPCIINYHFKRTAKDNRGRFKGSKYRYANYHTNHANNTRTFVMVYGLRFLIMVLSKGNQFNFLVFLQNVGSLLCYLGVWTTISTMVFYLWLNKRQKDLCVKMESASTEEVAFIEKYLEMRVDS